MNRTGEDATQLLRRLVGVPLSTPTRHNPNTVLAVLPPDVIVATDKDPDGQPVPIQQVQEGLDRLLEAGEIGIHPDTLGYRSSFIGAVLLQLPGAALVASTPPRIRLTQPVAQETRRPLVVIHPSGSLPARRHWHHTIDHEARFAIPPLSEALEAGQLDALNALHPGGSARFWGATGIQDRNMQRLSPGDVVLFTWSKAVRAVGEIGVLFQNADTSLTSSGPQMTGTAHTATSTVSARSSPLRSPTRRSGSCPASQQATISWACGS